MIETSDPVDPGRLIIPGLAGFYRRFAPLSYALIRFSAGAVLLPHGIQKVLFGSVPRMSENIARAVPDQIAYPAFLKKFRHSCGG